MSNPYFKSLRSAAKHLKLNTKQFAALIDAKLIATVELSESGRLYVSNAELKRFREQHSA